MNSKINAQSIEANITPFPVNHPLVEIGGWSEAGCKLENQDAFAATLSGQKYNRYKGYVAVIADGCSSAKFAREAAQMVVTQFISGYMETPESWSVNRSVAKVLHGLNRWMYRRSDGLSHRQTQRADWLCTFSCLIIKSNTAYLFHVGDSRISRLRGSEMETLTRDHQINGSLTKALGADPHVEIDAHQYSLDVGDVFVLTTDGIHEVLSEQGLAEGFAVNEYTEQTLVQCSKQLAQLALQQGSQDNLSCLAVSIKQLPQQQLDETYRKLTRRKIPPILKPGQILDGYTVLKEIHASPRSHLYLVKSEQFSSPVVLKAPSQNFVDDFVYLQGFIKEAWVGEKIASPFVVKVLDTASHSPFLYHICEYSEGQTLDQWRANQVKVELAEVQAILKQLAQAIRAFQRQDMVHRDIKPDNVMIDTFGVIKLIDYGSTFVASDYEEAGFITETQPAGTLTYSAPEVLNGVRADFRSDLYSLALLGFELLTGRLPFKRHSNSTVLKPSPRSIKLRTLRPDIPFWFEHALEKALSINPDTRHQAISDFIDDMTQPCAKTLDAYEKLPWLEKDPVRFWQITSLILSLIILTLLFY